MTKTSEPILFFGSGPVAAESLRLLAQDFAIEAVVTKPRAPHHKGSVPVLEVAEELHLLVATVADKVSLNDLFATSPFKSRLAVLVDFGIIVSQKVIDYFPLGIINSHFSLLPEWRGADPITFSILSGQKQTGVSLMLLVAAMDEGPLLAQGVYDIKPDETTISLTDRLVKLSASLLKDVMPRYVGGEILPRSQEEMARMSTKPPQPSYSRRLVKGDGRLDWNKPAEILEREIRAFLEWPKSYATIGKLEIVVTKAHIAEASGKPGQAATIDNLPAIYCGVDALVLDRVKPAGKKEMTGEAFLAGYKKVFLGY